MGESLLDAFGSYGYYKPFYGINMLQYKVSKENNDVNNFVDYKNKLDNHDVKNYLTKLLEIEKFNYISTSFASLTDSRYWLTLKNYFNWKLEKNKNNSTFRIVTAQGLIIHKGLIKEILPIWKQYAKLYDETSNEKIKQIKVKQDRINLVSKVIPIGWDIIDEIDGWRLQKKKVPFRGIVYRIIDPKDYQRACGRKEQMEDSFLYIKIQLIK